MRKVALILTTLFVTLFASSLSGCTKVPIKNEEFCADKGRLGAVCNWTNGGPTTQLTKPEWDQKRFGMACTEVESITRLLGVIRKLCFDSGRCTYEEYKSLEKAVMKLYRKSGFSDIEAMEQLEGL